MRLGLISSIKLDGTIGIQSVKSAGSILRLELQTHTLHPQKGNEKGHKTNKYTQLLMHMYDVCIYIYIYIYIYPYTHTILRQNL